MKSPAIVVPFKSKNSKSRLSSVLEPSARRRFAKIMLSEVLAVVREARLISRCYVVSSDATALSVAKLSGASPVLERSDKGVNAAIARTMNLLKDEDRFLVIPSDLPLLKPKELRHALSLGSQFRCVLSPSRSFDGTNLFLFSRKDDIALSYDSNSFWNHVDEAAKKGASLAVYSGKGVVFDVDRADDLWELARARINTPSTRFAKKATSERAS